MSKYILGIDAGGTKTHGTLVDSSGAIVATNARGGGNWERFGIQAAQAVLTDVIEDLLVQVKATRSDISSATFALAGIDWPEDLELFEEYRTKLGFSGRSIFLNDAFAALYAGAPDGCGVVSIAGTGGKSAGCNGLLSIQSMGMELGEGGGGGQLISLALEKVASNYHAGITNSALSDLLLSAAGKSTLLDFFYAVARENLRVNEQLAPAIFDLAASGDSDAVHIVSELAHQHAIDVINIGKQLEFKEEVIVIRSGGLHTAGNAIFDQSFSATLDLAPFPFRSEILTISPSYGSVIHASHAFFGGANQEFISHLLQQAKERGNR
jgi:N-acetylglucosamine kinase-like BadF-type ATPase